MSLASSLGMVEPPAYDPLYALVVVRTSLRRRIAAPEEMPAEDEPDHLSQAFHYRVPAELRERVRLGQLIWAPFGSRDLQGVIVGWDRASPVEDTRPLDRIVHEDPLFDPPQLALARWISATYLAPLSRVIWSMLPPGLTRSVETIVERTADADPEEATEAQRAILALLAEKGPLMLRQIGRLTDQKGWRSTVDALVHKGWVTKDVRVMPPSVRPKRVLAVRVAPDATPEALPERAVRQRETLAYLAEHARGGNWLPAATVIDRLGISYSVLTALRERALVEACQRQVWRDPLEGISFVPDTPPRLTRAQADVWETIRRDMIHPSGCPFLLQGVTGSGKTEIYLQAAEEALTRGQGVIVLVPEIALTPQTIRRFGARFPSTLAVMHSRLSDGERYDQWRQIRRGDLRLVIGSRSALFAPVRNLGLVVVDEEHETSYKQDRTPHYHAREAAVELARLAKATCILGSATPSLESAYLAEQGGYRRLLLPQRIMGHRRIIEEQSRATGSASARYHAAEMEAPDAMHADLPPVSVVDMRSELKAHNTSMFSRALAQGLERVLQAGEQAILFLNRRGTSTFVMCRDCGHVLRCPRCEVPYTYHSDQHRLVCHHCGRIARQPDACPVCGSKRIKHFGAGTQRVEQEVKARFPGARVVRWDTDATASKGSHDRLLSRFVEGDADVLVGTQMIAKGLDLPLVTLVGVVAADTALHLPDFRSAERTFQLLTQVAGRAGRSVLGGEVIIQTYTPDHYAIQAASRHDYDAFYRREICWRREQWYPPISRIARLLYETTSARAAQEQPRRLHALLAHRVRRLGLPDVDLIGPAPAFFARERGRWRWHILVRARDPAELLAGIRLPLGWRLDVDPVSLL
jgi:primosomal protein N' (replication factor Y) (superfamily II helicase)